MGIETGLAIGSGVIGAGLQYGENRAARKRAQQVSEQGSAIAGQPLPNIGQDSLLQMLRSNPDALKPFMFDSSSAFKSYAAQDAQNLNDQVNQLSAGAGSLGARFGSGFASKSALLRQRVLADTGARNAGIAQNSFNNGIAFGFQNQSQQQSLLQLIQQGVLGQRGQQLQALGLGVQANSGLPSTGALVSQTGGDIASLLTLMKILNNKPAGAGSPTPVPLPGPIPGSTTTGGGWPG